MLGFDSGEYSVGLDLTPWHLNVMGKVHGGVICTMLDTAMARAYLRNENEVQKMGATLELKTNFIKGVSQGRLVAYGKLISATRRTAYVEGRIVNVSNELIAKASATVILFENNNSK